MDELLQFAYDDGRPFVYNVHGDNHVQIFPGNLRDWFAGQALVGWLASLPADSYAPPESTAKQVYEYADAMLKAREQLK